MDRRITGPALPIRRQIGSCRRSVGAAYSIFWNFVIMLYLVVIIASAYWLIHIHPTSALMSQPLVGSPVLIYLCPSFSEPESVLLSCTSLVPAFAPGLTQFTCDVSLFSPTPDTQYFAGRDMNSSMDHFAVVNTCGDTFDFTPIFEESFLSILPSAILLLLTPVRLVFLKRRARRVGGRTFEHLKLLTICLLSALELALLILWSAKANLRTRTTIVSAALAFVDTIAFFLLSYSEHSRSLRPSVLLNSYLLISITFDAVRLRTLWLLEYDTSVRILFSVCLAVKCVIFSLEESDKRRFLSPADKSYGPEKTSGLISLSFFWWLNHIIREGFKKVLCLSDLYPIDPEMTSERLREQFGKYWSKKLNHGKYQLMFAVAKQSRWSLFSPVIPRLALLAFTLCQPLLMKRFLDYLSNPDGINNGVNTGYGLIGAYAIVYLGIAISTGFYWHRAYRWITLVRGLLVTAIYQQTMHISITAVDNSTAVTLMSIDVERIQEGLQEFHEIWASIVQTCIATYILETEVGLACLAPLIVVAITTGASLGLGPITGKSQLAWMTRIDKRIRVTSSILGNMKSIKMSGLSDKLSVLLQSLRIDEIKSASAFRLLSTVAGTLSYVPLLISPVATFVAYTLIEKDGRQALNISRIFTSYSLILLLTQPLAYLFQSIPTLISAVGCCSRIQEFLLATPRQDTRQVIHSPGKPSNQSSELVRADGKIEKPQVVELKEIAPHFDTLVMDLSTAISVRDASFGWPGHDGPKFVLRNIKFQLQQATFTVIVGPVASGKSTLLKALLGEVPYCNGTTFISSRDVAFCDQTTFLQNCSVQRNIIGFSELDVAWYNTVIHACGLRDDIATFHNGDQTLVGSGGIILSGGQKQRVAIARAVYSRKRFAFLDDVFSGQDADTQRHISTCLFGPQSLFRTCGTTVVLVTHAVNLLPMSDWIIALSSSGEIVEQGTFGHLSKSNGYISSLSLHASTPEAPVSRSSTAEKSPESELLAPVDDLLPGSRRQFGDMSTYMYYFKAVGWIKSITFLFLMAGFAFFLTFPVVWLNWWANANTKNPGDNARMWLGVYAVLQAMGLVLLFIGGWQLFCRMAVTSGKNLHLAIVKTVIAAPMSFFHTTDNGVVLNLFSQDIQLIDGEIPISLLNVTSLGLIAISQAVLIASATWYIAAGFPVLIVVFYYIQKYYLRTSRQLRFMDLEAKSPLYTQFTESLNGLATIRAFGWETENCHLNNELLDSSQKPFYLLYMVQRWLTLVLDLIDMALAILIVGLAFSTRHSVAIGFTGVALTQVISFTAYMKEIVLYWTKLETAIGAISRIKSFQASTDVEESSGEKGPPPENWPDKGQVEFRGLRAKYSANAESDTLNNISLTIKPGEKIGICGRSGSGKSSLILTLFRMLEITQGSIIIDGIDLTSLTREDVRHRLNAIPQDAYFLSGSVKFNLDPWDEQLEHALIEALKKVHLWEKINDNGGLYTEFDVGLLSHGQRQMFCLARAILRPSNIVILDEVTSSVDHKTDELMQSLIREEFKHHTVIAVAHRLETILDFDKIAVLSKGDLVEYDSPAELLAVTSAFRDLYNMYCSNRREHSETESGDEMDELGTQVKSSVETEDV